mmetsp:Transcript_28870/g.72235  ORF Transcript_28870/g.72235 Transcript_28870/m.72235 type:complete len:85 (+) Transcript_28870:3000-3254(+)
MLGDVPVSSRLLAAVPPYFSRSIECSSHTLGNAFQWIIGHIENFQTLELQYVLWNLLQHVSTEVKNLQVWQFKDRAWQLRQLVA